MRILLIMSLLLFCLSANADIFYQNNNPFPSQTSPETLNNIYEAEPSVLQKELNNKKKSWFKVKQDSDEFQQKKEIPGFTEIHEGINESTDGSFYIFK